MPIIVKKRAKKADKKKAVRIGKMPNLENDPYFLKKAEQAKEMLKQAGIVLKP